MDNLLHLAALCFIPLLFGLCAYGVMDIVTILRKSQKTGQAKSSAKPFGMFLLIGQKPPIHN